MTEKETTSGGAVWRKRAIASVGALATVAAGSVVLAGAANAATGQTLTLTAPASISNTGTITTDSLAIDINNAGAGNAAQTGPLVVNVVAPAGVACSSITFTGRAFTGSSIGAGTSGPLTLTSPAGQTGSCTFSTASFVDPANSDFTVNYGVQISSAPISGNVTFTATLDGSTSNTGTSPLAGATTSGTTFSTTPPPAAIIYQKYLFNEIKTVGTATTYSAFGAQSTPGADGLYDGTDAQGNQTGLNPAVTRTATKTVFNSKTGLNDAAIDLSDNNDGTFLLDVVTGNIVSQGTDVTNSKPFYTFTIIANVATGGATVPVAGIGGGSKAQPTPGTNVGDIADSPKFTLPVLFSDVSAGGTFSDAIYSLANQGAISGFLDGTFRPTSNVSRQAFAHFLYAGSDKVFGNNGATDGPCDASSNPSQFPDVPNGSQFCTSINTLSTFNIVNGYSDGKFHPSSSISRQAIAAFIFRYSNVVATGTTGSDAKCTSPTGFSDVSTSNPFCGDIEYLVSAGFAKGYSDGTFKPAGSASRQAVAQFIFNAENAQQSAQARRALVKANA